MGTMNGVCESTRLEQLDALVKVMARNTYTGELQYLSDEADVSDISEDTDYEFLVNNIITGETRTFYNIYDAFDYKYSLMV